MPAPSFDPADLLERALRRADMENSSFIGAAEGAVVIEKAWQEFYLLMVGQFDELCVKIDPYGIGLTAGTSTYGLPTDYLKLKMIELVDAGTGEIFYRMRRISSLVEAVQFRVGNNRRGKPTHYWLAGSQETTPLPGEGPAYIRPLPLPDAAYTANIWYVPNLSLADVSGSGLAMLAGWDQYVVLTAAMSFKDKEESDCSVLMAERTTLWDNLKRVLTPQDESEPGHVVTMTQPYGRGFNDDPFMGEEFG